MWKLIQSIFRLLAPALIAIAALALPILPSMFGDLSINPDPAFAQVDATDTLTITATSTPTEGTLTPTPDETHTPTPTLQTAEIEPDSIVVYQELSFLSGFGWDYTETEPRDDSKAALSIYVNQTHAPQVNIYHPPLNYENGSIDLGVTKIPTCSSLIDSTAQAMDINCYSIAVPVGTLVPGEYSAKLFVDIADQPIQEVDVTLKVRANMWWMFITVAVGVLATEFLVYWNRRGWYSISWKARRVTWIDLLSEDLEWIFGKDYSSDEVALNTILQLAKAEIRTQINSLRDWFKKGRNGEITLADIPVGGAQDIEMLFPLRNSIDAYITNCASFFGDGHQVSNLEDQLNTLRENIIAQSGDHIDNAINQVGELYIGFGKLFPEQGQESYYLQLKALYQMTPPNNDVIKTAWQKIEAIQTNGKGLKDTFEKAIQNQLRNELSHKAEVCKKLTDSMAKFKSDVLDVSADQCSKVEAITDTPVPIGRAQIISLLQSLSDLAHKRELAELSIKMANEPLCFTLEETKTTMQEMEKLLTNIESKLNQLNPANIKANATANHMLRQIREHLQSAEEEMSNVQDDGTLEATWRGLTNHYKQDRRFFKLGKRILKLSKDNVHSSYLLGAYKYMLEGRILEAEVELERAERYRSRSLNDLKQPSRNEFSFLRLWKPIKELAVKLFSLGKNLVTWIKNKLVPHKSQAEQPQPPDSARQGFTKVLANLGSWIKKLLTYVYYMLLAAGWIVIFIMIRFWLLTGWASIYKWLFVGSLVLLLGYLTSLTPWGKVFRLVFGEFLENFWPGLVRIVTALFSQSLTIFVAVALVIVTYQIADTFDTWGQLFDFLAAFVWGVVANRVAEPAQSGWQTIVDAIATPKKPIVPDTASTTEVKP